MAVYALVDENNIVIDIRGGDAAWVATQTDRWIETDPDTVGGRHRFDGVPLRKNFAQLGYTYDEILDAFIPPKTTPSWVVDPDTGQWVAPVPYPNDGGNYVWNETRQQWDSITLPPQGDNLSI